MLVNPALGRLKTSLGDRYRLERELGAGGMATVYLAEDLRHHRRVAVKVLRPELAAIIGADRFLAEIRTTANLQHPHILPLFDSGEADGFLFYVMPYVEGESLRDRLRRETQLPIADAVRIASEVASALDYAHRHGVIHRDIKPENILLHDGQALVADFGIALALTSAGSGSGSRMTETGMSLGTPHYMSPEQAMGEREITGRSDIYALGAVLYEMLVGEPPFTGPSVQAIVAKVLTEEPRPLLPKRHTIPPHLEAVVLTSLEKLPADRYASAGDFLAALRDTSATRAHATAAMPAAGRHDWRRRAAVPALGAAVLLAGVAGWLAFRPRPQPVVQRYGLALPASEEVRGQFAVSPDGRQIVYLGPAPGGTQLWIKAHDRAEAVPLPGTDGGVRYFTFSPDGASIAFTDNSRQLRRLPLSGGAAVTLADSVAGNGLAWLDDGTVVYVRTGTRSLWQVPAVGGAPAMLVTGDSTPAILPKALPGSRALLFTVCRGGTCGVQQDLWSVDLRTRKLRLVVRAAASGEYSASGHLLYVRRDGAMFAAPFDPATAEMKGPPIPVLDSVLVTNGGTTPLFSVSRGGTLVMRPGLTGVAPSYEMVWVDRAGRETPVDPAWRFKMAVFGGNAGWSLSPDGTRLAIGLATDAGDDIWVKRLPTGPVSRVSFDTASEFRPRWMPDGRSVSFTSTRGAAMGSATGARLYRRAADATGSDSLLLNISTPVFEARWTRDAKWLVLRMGGTINLVGGRDISLFRPGVDSAPVALLASPQFDESAAAISPDGRWIAYQSNEAGREDVYLRPFPGVDAGKRQVSTGGGTAPLWAPNGRELFYVNASRDMMSVAVGPGPELDVGEPKVLFHLGERLYLTANENYTPFDISPDGQRFIMARQIVDASRPELPVVVAENWFEELRARMKR